MSYIPPADITLPPTLKVVLPVQVPTKTLFPPVPTDPVTPLRATSASDITSPPPYRNPQQIPLPPNPYPTWVQPGLNRTPNLP
jgi:hypothetical protein